jgi:hypothetical protein
VQVSGLQNPEESDLLARMAIPQLDAVPGSQRECMPLGGVERPRRVVHFARLIIGASAPWPAFGGNLSPPDCHTE